MKAAVSSARFLFYMVISVALSAEGFAAGRTNIRFELKMHADMVANVAMLTDRLATD